MKQSQRKKLGNCVEWVANRIDSLQRPPESLTEAPDSRLQVTLRRAGFMRRTDRSVAELREAFERAGIRTYPELSDPTVTRDERIYFFREPIPGLTRPGALFATEHLLEDFLVANFDRLEALRDLRLRSRQYRFPGSQRVIDLLCEDRATQHLVGIELKHGPADRGLPAQMIDYMIELERPNNKERRPGFRGVVVTGQPDSRLKRLLDGAATERGFRIDWLVYRVSVELSRL